MKKIINFLELSGTIDAESVAYREQDLPFTYKEFSKFTDKILNDAGGWRRYKKYLVSDVMFETYVIPFKFNKKEYRLVEMNGQGTSHSLCMIKECDEWMERNKQYYLNESKIN